MAMHLSTVQLEKAVPRCFPFPHVRQVVGAAALAAGSAAMIYGLVYPPYPVFKKPRDISSWVWEAARIALPALSPLQRQVTLGGAALVISAVLIYAFYPYLNLVANTPYPKSYILRFTSQSRYCLVALLGVGMIIGQRCLVTLFKVNISFNPFKMFISKHETKSIPVMDWDSFPKEVLATLILPRLIDDDWGSFRSFRDVALVCKTWRDQLYDPQYLTSEATCIPLESLFTYQSFQVNEVVAFFDTYLPKEHQGAGLHLALASLESDLQDYITPAQLEYFVERFPEASMDALTICLSDQDDAQETAKLLSVFLKKGHIGRLTIAPERLRNPHHASLCKQILSQKQKRERTEFNTGWKTSPFPRHYPTQMMRLLQNLEGSVSLLRVQRPALDAPSTVHPSLNAEVLDDYILAVKICPKSLKLKIEVQEFRVLCHREHETRDAPYEVTSCSPFLKSF